MTLSAHAALTRYLDRLLLRTPLSEAERGAILDLPCELEDLGAHVDFVRPGDTITRSCLVVEGLVARFAQIRDGSRSIVAFHIPGDMADLQAVVAPHITWALQTLAPTTLLKIPREAVQAAAERHPGLAIAFWRDTVADANVLAQWIVNVARKDALARVSHMLCEMRTRYAVVGLATPQGFPFPITQADLADALGLTPVHLNRVLRRLREAGIATKTSQHIQVGDPRRLGGIGEFDASYLQLAATPPAAREFA